MGTNCYANCTEVFRKEDITVLSPQGKPILQGWRENKLSRLWIFALSLDKIKDKIYKTTSQKGPEANRVYDLPIVEALDHYMHAQAGFSVKSTIKHGNYNSWPILTYNNAAKYCPHSVETIKGHMVQSSQGIISTKNIRHKIHNNQIEKSPKTFQHQQQSDAEEILPQQKTKEIHIWDQPISKLYNDNCGRSPIMSRSGNEYIMIAYHCDSNTILQAPFLNRKDKHIIRAYNSIMQKLADRWHNVDIQIFDNEVSAEFKKTIKNDWGATYQLVTPNVHRWNIAEGAIRTFKVHFLAFLAGVDPDFPKYMWDNLLVQRELTINLLRQTTLNPRMSAWKYYNLSFDYSATPLGPLGCKIMIHKTSNTRKYLDQWGREGFSVGPALQHYICIQVIDGKTTALIITENAEYLHRYLT